MVADTFFAGHQEGSRMDSHDRRGFVHVYTGDGKGKTTAAMGLALRAAGAGWPVFIGQFVKGRATSETAALRRFADRVTCRQFGSGQFIEASPTAAEIDSAERGLAECREAVVAGDYSLVVLDEANVAAALGLFPLADLTRLIDRRPPHVELVLTGRWAHEQVLERADLVTEMREVKHYYRQGILARTGIEQ
jgi:cob(I)alamin adenosyltransferase